MFLFIHSILHNKNRLFYAISAREQQTHAQKKFNNHCQFVLCDVNKSLLKISQASPHVQVRRTDTSLNMYLGVCEAKCESELGRRVMREKRGQATTIPPHILFIFNIYFRHFVEDAIFANWKMKEEKSRFYKTFYLFSHKRKIYKSIVVVCLYYFIICLYQNIFVYTSLPLIIIRTKTKIWKVTPDSRFQLGAKE